MIYLKEYNDYKGDYLLESINEGIDVKSFINKLKNYLESIDTDKIKSYFKSFLNKISNLSKPVKRGILYGAIPLFVLYIGAPDIKSMTNDDPVAIEVVNKIVDETEEAQTEEEVEVQTNFKKGYEFVLSQNGWDSIRDEESLRLTPYKIGDGKITVGWGHAENISTSKYKVGVPITEEEAQKLLKQDLTESADAVRKVFTEWEEKGIDVPITQEMFDALVSVTFNAGVGGMRNSDFIQELKKGDYEATAESLRNFKSNLWDKYPGLKKRRNNEANTFLKNYEAPKDIL